MPCTSPLAIESSNDEQSFFDGVPFDLVLAAGRAAHGQNIAILGVSRFEVRNSNYWQLDCLSGKAPDFSEKDPLWSLFVCPTQGVSPSRRFQFQKRSQLFICMRNVTLPVAAMRISNPDPSPAGINR